MKNKKLEPVLKIDNKKMEAELLNIKTLLIMLLNKPERLQQKFTKESYDVISRIHQNFMALLNNVLAHKYRVSIVGFYVNNKVIHKGLLQNETKNLSNFFALLTNHPDSYKALDYLEENIAVLKNANYALMTEISFLSSVSELIDKNCQQQSVMSDSYLKKLDKISSCIDEMHEMYPLSVLKQLVLLCDSLMLFQNNSKAVENLNKFYEILYHLLDNINDPVLSLKIIVGYSFYMDTLHDEKSLNSKLLDFFSKNAVKNNFADIVTELVGKFINSNHYGILLDEYENNQSVLLWGTYRNIINNENTAFNSKMDALITRIKEYEAAQLTDEELCAIQFMDEECAKTPELPFTPPNVVTIQSQVTTTVCPVSVNVSGFFFFGVNNGASQIKLTCEDEKKDIPMEVSHIPSQ